MDTGPLDVTNGPPLHEVLAKVRAEGKAGEKLARLKALLQPKKEDDT